MQANGILPLYRDHDIDQNINPTNKPVPQETKGGIWSVICYNDMSSDTNTRKGDINIYI